MSTLIEEQPQQALQCTRVQPVPAKKVKSRRRQNHKRVYVIQSGYFNYDTMELTRVRFFVRGYHEARNFHPPIQLDVGRLDYWSEPRKAIRPPKGDYEQGFVMEVLKR